MPFSNQCCFAIEIMDFIIMIFFQGLNGSASVPVSKLYFTEALYATKTGLLLL
jgi:hypothetical protein